MSTDGLKVTGVRDAAECRSRSACLRRHRPEHHRRGTITAIDTGRGEAQPGVLDVLTPDNAPRLLTRRQASTDCILSLLQSREVRYNGEPSQSWSPTRSSRRRTRRHSSASLYRRGRPAITTMDPANSHAQPYPPKKIRQGRAPRHSAARRSRGGIPARRWSSRPNHAVETTTRWSRTRRSPRGTMTG